MRQIHGGAFHQAQQFDSAAIVVRLGLSSCSASDVELARLHIIDGILKVEALKDQEAQAAFDAALGLVSESTLPTFAGPKARRIFDTTKTSRTGDVLAKLDAAYEKRGDVAADSQANALVDRIVGE